MWKTLNMLELKQDMALQSVLRTIYFSSTITPLWRGWVTFHHFGPWGKPASSFYWYTFLPPVSCCPLSDYLLTQKDAMLDWLGNYWIFLSSNSKYTERRANWFSLRWIDMLWPQIHQAEWYKCHWVLCCYQCDSNNKQNQVRTNKTKQNP